ncbi:hypothetical protein ACWFRJ_07410 [Streptomyces sp. NPDC055239]
MRLSYADRDRHAVPRCGWKRRRASPYDRHTFLRGPGLAEQLH